MLLLLAAASTRCPHAASPVLGDRPATSYVLPPLLQLPSLILLVVVVLLVMAVAAAADTDAALLMALSVGDSPATLVLLLLPLLLPLLLLLLVLQLVLQLVVAAAVATAAIRRDSIRCEITSVPPAPRSALRGRLRSPLRSALLPFLLLLVVVVVRTASGSWASIEAEVQSDFELGRLFLFERRWDFWSLCCVPSVSVGFTMMVHLSSTANKVSIGVWSRQLS